MVFVQYFIPNFVFFLSRSVVVFSCVFGRSAWFHGLFISLPSVLQLGYHHLYRHWGCNRLWSTWREEDILPHQQCKSEPGKQSVRAVAVQCEEQCHQGLGEKNQVTVLLYCARWWPSSGFYKYRRAFPQLLFSKMKGFFYVLFWLTLNLQTLQHTHYPCSAGGPYCPVPWNEFLNMPISELKVILIQGAQHWFFPPFNKGFSSFKSMKGCEKTPFFLLRYLVRRTRVSFFSSICEDPGIFPTDDE